MSTLRIWVDADACPIPIKEILFRAAQRTGVELTLVANHFMRVPPAKNITLLRVESGFDVADNEIVKRIDRGDILISSDIPLASEAIEKGAFVLSPRGEELSEQNIKQRLNIRDFMDTMRASGVQTGGPPPLSQADKQQFANHLDRILTAALNAR